MDANIYESILFVTKNIKKYSSLLKSRNYDVYDAI